MGLLFFVLSLSLVRNLFSSVKQRVYFELIYVNYFQANLTWRENHIPCAKVSPDSWETTDTVPAQGLPTWVPGVTHFTSRMMLVDRVWIHMLYRSGLRAQFSHKLYKFGKMVQCLLTSLYHLYVGMKTVSHFTELWALDAIMHI